jgi:SAM-dependent methyltransferase
VGLFLSAMHGTGEPSPWVTAWLTRLAPAGTVDRTAIDVACGSGRHLRWLAAQGWRCTGVDRDAAALAPLAAVADTLLADLENGPWPLAGRQFDAVVVTNYLWRPLMAPLQALVAPGGVLVYETFADGHQTIGRPSRPEFLLQPGELLRAFPDLRVVAYEDGFEALPERFVQRLVAVREVVGAGAPARHRLRP